MYRSLNLKLLKKTFQVDLRHMTYGRGVVYVSNSYLFFGFSVFDIGELLLSITWKKITLNHGTHQQDQLGRISAINNRMNFFSKDGVSTIPYLTQQIGL